MNTKDNLNNFFQCIETIPVENLNDSEILLYSSFVNTQFGDFIEQFKTKFPRSWEKINTRCYFYETKKGYIHTSIHKNYIFSGVEIIFVKNQIDYCFSMMMLFLTLSLRYILYCYTGI